MYHIFYSHLKSSDHFLTLWRAITCILVIIERNFRNKLKRSSLPNQKYFLEMLLHFSNLHKILSIFKKKNTFIASIFPKLLIAKNVVTWMPESCFRTPFRIQRLKGSQTLLKSARQRFYPNFPLISNKFSCLSYLLIGSEILEPFVNTLMADHMYSCHNWKKSLQQVQTQLSSKGKTFSGAFIAFLKST